MDSERPEAVILRDRDGNYYAIPRDVLERSRIPDHRKAEFEESVGLGDVSGFSMDMSAGATQVDGSYLVDEAVEPWPVVPPRGGGIGSALRSLIASRLE